MILGTAILTGSSSLFGSAIVYSIPTPDDSPMGVADAADIALNGRVMNSVESGGPAGPDHDLLDEGADEGFGLG